MKNVVFCYIFKVNLQGIPCPVLKEIYSASFVRYKNAYIDVIASSFNLMHGCLMYLQCLYTVRENRRKSDGSNHK